MLWKLLWPVVLYAAPYQPGVLREVAERVRAESPAPVVVFDLDDTLIDTRVRTRRVLRDFVFETRLHQRLPVEAERLSRITLRQLHYDLRDTFAALRIENGALLAEAEAFWRSRFFSDVYAAGDEALPQASSYVRSLHAAGAKVVYLTGRDQPNMYWGTLSSLRKLGFPLGENTELMMKPDAKMNDQEFKRGAMGRIREMGKIVGVFENEPANLNILHEAFPRATAVFLDTQHSSRPDIPFAGATWVKDFRL